ncbi:MAG: SAF domain-containing protein, partial [Chloroflexota bacterium]|nr:SAF domain-containing protein [Chloroflexota bacterium]
HKFALDPDAWADMVARTRELERALGSPVKRVADNERETVVLQRRCLRAARDIKVDEEITKEMIDVLRPATPGAIPPKEIETVVGTKAAADIPAGEALFWTKLVSD